MRGEVALVCKQSGEVGIPDAMRCCGTGHEDAFAQARVVLPEVAQGIDLSDGYAAVQMCAHVVRLGRRGVVHIAADVAVVVFRLDVGY